MRESRTLTWSGELTDEEHARRRDARLLLCHCPDSIHHRDPDCPQQCIRCLRRIDRCYDSMIQSQSQEYT